MKANEYVKQNGWVMARKAVAECTYGYGIDLDELKRLVESYELVESYGGINACIETLYMLHELTENPEPLREALADVESCYD